VQTRRRGLEPAHRGRRDLLGVKSFATCQHHFSNGVTSVTEAAEPK